MISHLEDSTYLSDLLILEKRIEEYAKIGTVEKLKEKNDELERWHADKTNKNIKNPFANTSTLICHNCDNKDEYIEDLERQVHEYKTIGTIDECKAARDKQFAKTPDYEGYGYADGELVYDTWICPKCGEHYEIDYSDYDYCPKCGQHIQHAEWEN